MAATTMIAAELCCSGGCVSAKYQLAKTDNRPVQQLNVGFPPGAPLQATLASLITYRGPGSWKREALWDEYVVALQNNSDRPVTVESATLTDLGGSTVSAGLDPWALEKRSKALETQYRADGVAFVRTAGPGVLIIGAGAALASATTTATLVSAGVAGAAVAAVVVLPVYYLTVVAMNHQNKRAVTAEFMRRRLPVPLTLAPGEVRTGSVFFPMVRSPHSMVLHEASEAGVSDSVLPLDFLNGLHVAGTTAEAQGGPRASAMGNPP